MRWMKLDNQGNVTWLYHQYKVKYHWKCIKLICDRMENASLDIITQQLLKILEGTNSFVNFSVDIFSALWHELTWKT